MNNKDVLDENISEVASKLQLEEDEILKKAKQVEQEMFRLKEQKLNLLLKMFRDQLSKDYQKDLDTFKQEQDQATQIHQDSLLNEKNNKIIKLDKLHGVIEEQIKTLKLMQEDLIEKKDEIENAYLAAKEYIKREAQNNILEYSQRSKATIDHKVNEFKGQLSMKNF